MSLKQTFIQYGVPSDWAKKYEQNEISVATFKNTSKKNLLNKYNIPNVQIDFVKSCLTRQPIDEEIVQKLLENSNFLCCLCKGEKSHSFIIHHIEEYSISRDNSYKNLAVLCTDDHDLAHRKGTALTEKISEKQIREAKKNWEKQVNKENKSKAFKKSKPIKIKDWGKTNPYKELQSFAESDKEYFFGRKHEAEELINEVIKYNIIGLFGESGIGKTSLINAGIIPKFKIEGFTTISIRCLDEPIKRVREELLRRLKENKVSSQSIEELAATDTFPHLLIQLKSIIESENLNLIVIIDQFEEIFTRAREEEREQLSKGIIESLTSPPKKGKISFLLSLREDYIGDMWDWSHLYNLEEAWIHQYRIKRLTEEKAFEAIVEPLKKLGIKIEDKFVQQLILELKRIGDNFIYPPYLQIVCSKLFEEYKNQNSSSKSTIEFGKSLYHGAENAESIIADYLSESMLYGLTDEEKYLAQNVLDLLTGSEGLRTFLSIEDISRYLLITTANAQHIIEHLVKKKIVHPVTEKDVVSGYELVHDFLSKKFFEKLGPEAQRTKTTIDIFRKAFREWKQHGVLASRDRLEILYPNIDQLVLSDEEWTFLIKSSFSVYWSFENMWPKIIDSNKLKNICLKLINDKDDRIIECSIDLLGETKSKEITPILIEIIESPKSSIAVKDRAIYQFYFNLVDKRIINVLRPIIQHDKSDKLRKAAVSAFGKNLYELTLHDKEIIDKEIRILIEALNDSKTQVRKEVADVFSYTLLTEKSVEPLITRLKVEYGINSRKAMVSALGSLMRKGIKDKIILPVLIKISKNRNEDYRIIEEAKFQLRIFNKPSIRS